MRIVMKRTEHENIIGFALAAIGTICVAVMLAVVMAGCGSTARLARAETSTVTTEQTSVDRAAENSKHSVEKTTETSVFKTESERTVNTTETITARELSPPDSLGKQYAIRETITKRETAETERTGSNANRQANTEKESSSTATESEQVNSDTETKQSVSVVEEKERKRGIGGYLWAFGIGAATVAVVLGRKKLLPFVRKLITRLLAP